MDGVGLQSPVADRNRSQASRLPSPSLLKLLLHCALAAARCIVIGPVCLCVCVCVGGSVTTITRNCVHRSSPNWVCRYKGRYNAPPLVKYLVIILHLQLIKFWPSCAPGKGVCDGAKIFGSALLQLARAVFASPLSAFFIS